VAFKSTYQGKSSIESPESFFYDLRNRKVEGLLSHQADVLRVYKKDFMNEKDVAMEMPTGSGKTLIGLLIGEYRRKAFNERVVYLCPTNQLVHQVSEEARNKYGIQTLAFTGSQRDYDPRAKAEYSNGEAIAVTNYSSLFNTNPFFYNPNFIVLDDAHAAENYIAKHWSLSISRYDHEWIYIQLLEIIRDTIAVEQYERMKADSATPNDKSWVEKIPTSKLYDKNNQIISFLDEATASISELEHTWSVLRNHLSACHLYVNWSNILIRPVIPPTDTHPAFASANQRLYMSATLGLGGELERITGRKNIQRIKAPEGWDKHGVGRRLFFFPGVALKEHDCERLLFQLVEESPRALILVPDQQSADQLVSQFVSQTTKTTFQAKDIEQTKQYFTSHENAVAVLANRYDGINLAGEECRLEIMAGLPSAANLYERFLESRMAASLLLKDRIRTRIVQAIGRCTRSATDYSAVCILGDDLQDRLLQRENIQLYHPELQAELKFGYDESKQVEGIQDFIDMYRVFLKQDSAEWRGADAQIVARRQDTVQKPDPLMDVLQNAVAHEIDYQYAIWSGDYKRALECANRVTTVLSGDALKGYRGFWYYLAGSAAWLAAKSDPNFTTVARARFGQAANCTSSVTWLRNLVEDTGCMGEESEQDSYLSFLIERLEGELERMGTTSDRRFDKRVKEILTGLADQTDGKRFERAHKDLGLLLGYNSDNTEEDAGPDPWWIAGNDFCIAAEDYTETDGSKPIPVHKVRQVNDHPTWIQKKVSGLSPDTEYVRVIISPATSIERAAVTIARNIAYWNQKDFYEWANEAVQVIRTLRLDFTGVGNENWRTKAMAIYREAGLDPFSIRERLNRSSISQLQIV
jgi:hypothetical protein